MTWAVQESRPGAAHIVSADWNSKAVTAEEAVALIKPGQRVFVGSSCATPRTLLRALDKLMDAPAGVQLIHFLTDGAIPVVGKGCAI
jgi:acyl-CoA hydrolase